MRIRYFGYNKVSFIINADLNVLLLLFSFKGSSVETLTAEILVDYKRRMDLMKNTTATHLLSYALRERFICNMQSYRSSHEEFVANYLIYGHALNDDGKIII